jgi:hypothetical protein
MIVSALLRFALLNSGAISLSQTIYAEDLDNALNILTNMLAEWQVNRWLVSDLVDVAVTSTAAPSYTVGPAGTFVFADQRPDRIDAAFARLISTGADTPLYPFMSREGYDRTPNKSAIGAPFGFYYDPGLGATGTLYFVPVPDTTWSLHANAKASLGLITAISQTISLPAPYIAALNWGIAAALRSTYELPDDPGITGRATAALQAMINSIAQVPQVVAPAPGNRGGIYSVMPPPAPPAQA